MEYYICYRGRRLLKFNDKDEAIRELFVLKAAFRDLSLQTVDKKTGKVIGKISTKKSR